MLQPEIEQKAGGLKPTPKQSRQTQPPNLHQLLPKKSDLPSHSPQTRNNRPNARHAQILRLQLLNLQVPPLCVHHLYRPLPSVHTGHQSRLHTDCGPWAFIVQWAFWLDWNFRAYRLKHWDQAVWVDHDWRSEAAKGRWRGLSDESEGHWDPASWRHHVQSGQDRITWRVSSEDGQDSIPLLCSDRDGVRN